MGGSGNTTGANGGGSGRGGAVGGGSTGLGGGSGVGGSAATAGSGTAGSGTSGSDVPLDPTLLSKCTGTSPIKCTFNAPNGNYDLTAQVGDPTSAGTSQLSAETRHNQGPPVQTAAGAYALLTFTVNVRAEKHDGGQSAPANILDVVIAGAAPKLHGIGFRAAPNTPTIFFAGDSTAADWVDSNSSSQFTLNNVPGETGWAQALSMFLKPGIAVANYADSGETAGSFYTKFFSPDATNVIKAGDYVFIQFGTNDAKATADVAAYQSNLMKYVTVARGKNATPVILTPVSRKTGTAADPGFAGLDDQARTLAAAQNVALIDMTVLTRAYYATVADKNSLFSDTGTHFSELGATGVANVAATALKASALPLKVFVK
jgi:lysophospholipase L1-like esterase